MSAQDVAGVRIDQRLEAVDPLVEPSGREPAGDLFRFYAEFDSVRLRLRFTEAHRRYGRNCERDGWHAPVVWFAPVSLEQVSRNDLGVMTRFPTGRSSPSFNPKR